VSENSSWLDGELTIDPKVSASNRGLLVGLGVFETMKVTDGHVEFLKRHLDRLRRSWERIGTGLIDVNFVQAGVQEIVNANSQSADSGRLRVTVTECSGESSVLITLSPLQPWPETTSCVVLPWKRNESSPLVDIKCTSYAENILGLTWAKERGFSEGIYLNNAGNVSEGSTSNIFLVRGGEVLTPASTDGLLPGIVREVLLENSWAHEATLTLTDLETAEEIFVTSSTRGVHPVLQFGDRKFPQIGTATMRIMNNYQGLAK
jgi:branched-chain amino acid aminotransferase